MPSPVIVVLLSSFTNSYLPSSLSLSFALFNENEERDKREMNSKVGSYGNGKNKGEKGERSRERIKSRN